MRPAISFTASCVDLQGRHWTFSEWVDIQVPNDGFDYYRKKCWLIADRCFAHYDGVMKRLVLEPGFSFVPRVTPRLSTIDLEVELQENP